MTASPRRVAVAIAVTILATVVVYSPVVGFDFVRYDDPNYVQLHPRVSQGLSWGNVRWAMTAFEVGNWHPLTLLSHMADVSLFGMRPGAHHAVNVVFHAANASLLLALLTAGTGRLEPSFLAAILFAFHPLNVESVAWISQRKSVLAMFFLFLAMLAHVAWARRGGALRYLGGVAACAAALAAKPVAVALPVLLLLLDAWPLGRWSAPRGERLRRALHLGAEKVPYVLLAVASSAVTVVAQRAGGAMGTLESYPPLARLGNALFAHAWYPFRMIWPADLSLFYPTTLGPDAAWRVGGSALLVVAIALAAVVLARRAPYLAFGWAWYVAALFPVAGLVQFGTQIVADRYAYLPLIGLFVAISFGAADLLARIPVRAAPFLVGIPIATALVFAQQTALSRWRDSFTVLENGVRRAPDNAHALTNLGLLLVAQERLDEGIVLLKRAEAIVPFFRPIHVNLGYAYAKQGNLEEARRHYGEALTLGPDDGRILTEQGRILAQLGAGADAEEHLRAAVNLDPAGARAHLLLGTLLHADGRSEEALPFLERAAGLQPGDARTRLALGLALEGCGRSREGIAAVEEAVRLDPGFERARAELGRMRGGG